MSQHDDGQDDVSALTFFAPSESGSEDSSDRQALIFSTAGDGASDGFVDALEAQASDQTPGSATDVDAIRSATDVAAADGPGDEGAEYQARVANLSETVVVTALPDGSVLQVDLHPTVTGMSEAALADEVLVIADLARQKGLAKQQALLAGFMREFELNDAAQELIDNSTDLPTPEQAEAAQAQVFAARYASSD
jgi:hypothetical protein